MVACHCNTLQNPPGSLSIHAIFCSNIFIDSYLSLPYTLHQPPGSLLLNIWHSAAPSLTFIYDYHTLHHQPGSISLHRISNFHLAHTAILCSNHPKVCLSMRHILQHNLTSVHILMSYIAATTRKYLSQCATLQNHLRRLLNTAISCRTRLEVCLSMI